MERQADLGIWMQNILVLKYMRKRVADLNLHIQAMP